MAESSTPPRESSTAAPESSTAALETSNADNNADENTPLLQSGNTDNEAAIEPSQSTELPRSKLIYVLTTISLVASIATIVLAGVTFIALSVLAPRGYYLPSRIQDGLNLALAVTIFSALINAINFNRLRRSRATIPLLIDIIFDIVFSIYILAIIPPAIHDVIERNPYEGGCYYSRPVEDCKRKVWPIKVMAAITMSVAMVVAVVHVILLVAHFRRLVQTRFWRQPLRFPNGQLTLEVTVRMLREPERRDRVA